MALLLDLLVTGQTRLNDDTYAKDIYADKFIRTGSSDLYVLLGGGGHKLLSDLYKVTQTVTTSSNTSWRPLLLGMSYNDSEPFAPATVTDSVYSSHKIKVKPITGDIFTYGSITSNSDITLVNTQYADSPHLIFQRVNQNDGTFDWDFYVTNGYFKIRYNDGTWHDVLDMYPNNINTSWSITSSGGFIGNASSATIASTVVCPAPSSNYDRPIVGTPGDNTLYHTTLATVNWSTGNLKSGGLNSTGDVTTTKNFILESGDDDHFLLFRYANGATYNWRIGYLGSGSGDGNYLVFQSSKTDGNFVNALRFGLTTLNAVFYGNVGIGKDVPAYNLDVTGNARFTKEVVLTSGSSAAYDKTALSFVNTSGGEQARIGTDAGNGLGLYAGGNIYLRPASSFSASSIGLVIYSDNLTYNGNNVLHAGNSSVSGGGSSWNSSITVTMNGTSKTLTIPGNPNTDYRVTQTVTSSSNTSWRPIIVGQSYNDSEPFSPSTVTDSVLATHMVKLRPSTGEIVTQGSITLYNPTSGASPALIFQREKIDNYTSRIDWKIYDNGGNLYIDHNFGKWTNKLILRHDVVGLATLDGYDLFHTGNLFTRYLGVNGTNWTFASTYNSPTSTSIYAPTTAGTNNYVLKSTGGIPTWMSQSDISAGYAALAGTVTCTVATSNTDRPILVTNEANELYYTTKAKLNYSTGIISAGGLSTPGNVVLHNTAGGDSPHLHFQRGAQNDGTYDWDMYIKDGGLFKIRYNNGSWHEVLSMIPNDIYTSWSITADGGFIGTATNADKVDGYHADSFVHRLRRANLDITSSYSGMVPPDILSFKNGYPIYTDPEFAYGNNSIQVYNNSGGSAVTITRETSTTSGNSSGYCLHIKSAASGASPNGGGWYFATAGDQARVSVCVFRANIPAGYNVVWHSNSIGTGSSNGWLTSTVGTGKYEWYAYMVEWGFSPSSSFFFTLDRAASVDWFLAYANVIDISKSGYDGFRTRRSDALMDSNSGTAITASYYSGGFSSTPSWLAAWNNYHLTYVSPGSITVGKASTVACPATSSNYDRPIVGTPGDSTLYHSTKATVNWSTGRINCGGVTFTDSTGGSSFIRYASNNVDTKIFRVYSADHTYTESAAYGFDLTYTGSGSGNENKLVLKADNQAGSQVSVFTAYQDGNITFSNTPKVGSTAVSLTNHGHDGTYVKVLGAGTYNPLGAYVRPIVVNGSSYDFLSPYTTTGISIHTNNVTQIVSTSSNTSFRPVLLGASYSSSTSAPAFSDTTDTTIAAAKLFVKPDTGDLYLYSASGDSPHLVFQRVGQNDGTYDWDQYVSGGTFYLRYNAGSWVNVLSMYPSGVTSAWQITAPAFYESSDERLKDFYNSVDVDLDKLSSLPKKFFKWKSNPNGEFEIGTSAQELQKIYPQLVNTDDKGYLTVAYDKLSIIALRAIDKLYEMNKNLERRIQILESKR